MTKKSQTVVSTFEKTLIDFVIGCNKQIHNHIIKLQRNTFIFKNLDRKLLHNEVEYGLKLFVALTGA